MTFSALLRWAAQITRTGGIPVNRKIPLLMFYSHIKNEQALSGKEVDNDPVIKAKERRIELDYFRQVRVLTDEEMTEHQRLSAFIFNSTVRKV